MIRSIYLLSLLITLPHLNCPGFLFVRLTKHSLMNLHVIADNYEIRYLHWYKADLEQSVMQAVPLCRLDGRTEPNPQRDCQDSQDTMSKNRKWNPIEHRVESEEETVLRIMASFVNVYNSFLRLHATPEDSVCKVDGNKLMDQANRPHPDNPLLHFPRFTRQCFTWHTF